LYLVGSHGRIGDVRVQGEYDGDGERAAQWLSTTRGSKCGVFPAPLDLEEVGSLGDTLDVSGREWLAGDLRCYRDILRERRRRPRAKQSRKRCRRPSAID
jgi:hypothetical protein